ncbi:MAG: PilN domain-containing protein [Proteobacteria bacterium]|nr:PilN domain-containing protein [Burkholderiales bacterium]
MSQQINLYGAQFRPVRDVLPAPRLIGIALSALVLLAGLWGALAWQVADARSRAQSVHRDLESRKVEIAELAKTVGARRSDPKLDQDLARVEALHRARTELRTLPASGALGAPGGFSEQMRAFARQSSDGLWLTGFALSGQQVELHGRALSADLVPAYLRRLGQEKVMSGVALNDLRIAQPEVPKGSRDVAGPETKASPRTPAFIEFHVASEARAMPTQAPP